MHIGFLLLSAAASAAVASAFQDCDVSGTAELLVFSGTVNPRITVNRTLSAVVCEILRNSPGPAASCRVLGFTGIKLANGLVVRGGAADDVLLAAFAETDEVRGNVLAHSRAESARLRTGMGDLRCAASAPTADQVKTTDCLKVPIVGPDSPPTFNLKTDDGGCWVTEQPSNNCYNYANDIVTNSFAQPGRGSGAKWTADTCDAVKVAAERDGLVFLNGTAGRPPPKAQPPAGHIVSMHIWPGTNFHWVRMDADLTFSHKPGGTAARNVDNDGKTITDPSQANFSPWTEHCGYFNTVPSAVKIA